MKIGNPIQRLAGRASGIEIGSDEPRERWPARWRFAAFPARFGLEPRRRGHLLNVLFVSGILGCHKQG